MAEMSYYGLKRKAAQTVKQTVEFLKANPSRVMEVPMLLIELQQLGFSEKAMHKFLDPYIKTSQVIIKDDALQYPVSSSKIIEGVEQKWTRQNSQSLRT